MQNYAVLYAVHAPGGTQSYATHYLLTSCPTPAFFNALSKKYGKHLDIGEFSLLQVGVALTTTFCHCQVFSSGLAPNVQTVCIEHAEEYGGTGVPCFCMISVCPVMVIRWDTP